MFLAVKKNKGLEAKYFLIALITKDAKAIECAKESRKSLIQYFAANYCPVAVKCGNFDKYGRLLVELGDASTFAESPGISDYSALLTSGTSTKRIGGNSSMTYNAELIEANMAVSYMNGK
jgi:hypothetical protein